MAQSREQTESLKKGELRTCNSCRFAVKAENSTDEGFCYRFPPTAVPSGENTRSIYPPIALKRFWCGEYEAKNVARQTATRRSGTSGPLGKGNGRPEADQSRDNV